MKKLAVGLIVLVALGVLVSLGVQKRHSIIFALASEGAAPALLDKNPNIARQYWRGDYYTVVMLDARTFAIGEPRIPARNFNYLILGKDRALLFDAGAGHYDILPIVRQITDLPVTFLPSHLHFDHVGDMSRFDHIALVDLPHLRDQADDNKVTLTWEQHLGTAEGIPQPTFQVAEWIAPGGGIDLGGRSLQLIYTPGHTDDSVSLFDAKSKVLFSGDLIYPAEIFAFMPNSSLGDMLQSTEKLMTLLPAGTRIYGAHGPQDDNLPLASLADIDELKTVLMRIKDGSAEGTGSYPVAYRVTANMTLLTESGWLQNWDLSYPNGVDNAD